MVSAVMGAGKSVLIAELTRLLMPSEGWRIVITAPSIRLVEQLAETIGDCSRYYTHAKQTDRPVIIACCNSAPELASRLSEHGLKVALWIVDEAHKTKSATMRAAYAGLNPYAVLGFTATPFCSSERERLELFDEVVFSYDAVQAMRDGVIVKPVLRHYEGESGDIDRAVWQMICQVEGPGIVNADDIEDAEAYADALTCAGVPALPIHSKMSRAEQAATLERLREGAVKALVHVNMLTEGVDLPHLRWIALRCPSSSRVAFCQSVGRVLRTHPGKRLAYILDPHDMFNEFGLTYEAMLGCQPEPRLIDDAEALLREVASSDPIELPLILIGQLSGYLRRLCLAFQSEGLSRRDIKSKAWRMDWPSSKQLAQTARARGWASLADGPHYKLLETCCDAADQLNKGDVSDLLTVLFTLRRLGSWPQLDTME